LSVGDARAQNSTELDTVRDVVETLTYRSNPLRSINEAADLKAKAAAAQPAPLAASTAAHAGPSIGPRVVGTSAKPG